jgi:uncharacterized membrane protein
MLNFIARKIYLFWSFALLLFPALINVAWIYSYYNLEPGQGVRDRLISIFPLLFQYTEGIGYLSLFFSTLALMLSLRLIRDFNKYSYQGLIFFVIALYLSVFNVYNLI